MEIEERGETVIYVVTEPVTPLATHLAGLDLQGPQRSQYIAMGIYHCAKALSFLNNDCKLVSSTMPLRHPQVTGGADAAAFVI